VLSPSILLRGVLDRRGSNNNKQEEGYVVVIRGMGFCVNIQAERNEGSIIEDPCVSANLEQHCLGATETRGREEHMGHVGVKGLRQHLSANVRITHVIR
jgi:hypothetical protein